MAYCKIQIAPWLYHELNLETLAFPNEKQAVDILIEALESKALGFSLKEGANRKTFFGQSGGVLATVLKG